VILLTVFVFISVILAIGTNEVFSLVYLSDRYAPVSSDTIRSQLIAAGEAVLARSIWHTTAGFFVGVLMQGSFLIFSIIMLKDDHFSKRTAYMGTLSNGLDLLQHFLKPFLPGIAPNILIIAGLFYIFWYPFLGLDFLKISRDNLLV
jgi:hypothetical protein